MATTKLSKMTQRTVFTGAELFPLIAEGKNWSAAPDALARYVAPFVPVNDAASQAAANAAASAAEALQGAADAQGVKDAATEAAAAAQAAAEEAKAAIPAVQFATYDALRAYSGTAKLVTVTGAGIYGPFSLDTADVQTGDNGWTVIVDSSNRRWKRQYSGIVDSRWMDGNTDIRPVARGVWTTQTEYAENDLYVANDLVYITLSDHTSTSVEADLEAGLVGIYQTVTYSDLSNPARGVSMVAHAVDARVLADIGGAATVGYVQRGTGAVPRPVSEKLGDWISIKDYGAKGGGHDDTLAFNLAIAVIQTIALAQGATYPLPNILVPGDHYVISDTIYTYPWVRLVAIGHTLLNFSHIDPSKDGIVCRNPGTIPEGTLRHGTLSPFLDGSNGDIGILGPGIDTATGNGIVMGNVDAQSGIVRGTGCKNVAVFGWNAALRLDPVNLYLNWFEHCQFELNNWQVVIDPETASQKNSGEKISFAQCVFGRTQNAVLYHNCDAIDFNFIDSSFDYQKNVFQLGPNSRYWSAHVLACHIEGIAGLLVDGTQCGQYAHVTIKDTVLYPSGWTAQSVIASPSRLLCAGNPNSPTNLQLSIDNLEMRFDQPGYLGSSQFFQNATLFEARAIDQRGFFGCVSRSLMMNRDTQFTKDAIGTNVTALNAWSFTPPSAGSTSGSTATPPLANAGNALKLTSTNSANTGGFSIMGKEKMSVRAGESLNVGLDFYFPTATTFGDSLQLRAVLQFYDSGGNAINTWVPVFSDNIAALYANAKLPNYSSGRERWLPINSVRVVAPPGAASVTVGATGFGWAGDLYLTNVAVHGGMS